METNIIRRLQLLFLYGRIIYLFFKIFRMGTLEPVTIPDTEQTLLPLFMTMIMTKCFKEQRKTVFNTKQCHYQKLHIISYHIRTEPHYGVHILAEQVLSLTNLFEILLFKVKLHI